MKKYKCWKQATVHDNSDISMDSEHLGPHKAKPTLDFFYFRFPFVFSIFTEKYKYWKQATVRDNSDISTDSEHRLFS